MEASGIFVVPIVLIAVGMIQGRVLRIVHLLASILIWVSVWRHRATYDAANALGTLWKEESWTAISTAIMAYINCAVISAGWNGILRIRNQRVVLSIPMKGEIAGWP